MPARLNKQKALIILFHTGIWGFLFLIPLLGAEDRSYRWIFNRTWLPLIFAAAVFYINYLVLIKTLLFRNKTLLYIIINIILIAITIMVMIWIRELVKPGFSGVFQNRSPILSVLIFRHSFTLLLAVAAAVAVRSTEKWQEGEKNRKRLETEQLRSELVNLRYQIQPHFLYNTLNNIYSLIGTEPAVARETVLRLAKLMRYLLTRTGENLVPLDEEVDFIRSFIELHRIRFPENYIIKANLPEKTPDIYIPPLIFITLVENAFKHGVSADYGEIKINLVNNDGELHLRVENTVSVKQSIEGSLGTGIENLKRRLHLIYGDSCSLLFYPEGDRFIAELKIHGSKKDFVHSS